MIRKLPFYIGIGIVIICIVQVIYLKTVYGAVNTGDNIETTSEDVPMIEVDEESDDIETSSQDVPMIEVGEESDDIETSSQDVPMIEVGEEGENVEDKEVSQKDNSVSVNMVVDNVDSDFIPMTDESLESAGEYYRVLHTDFMIVIFILSLLCGLVLGFGIIWWVKTW